MSNKSQIIDLSINVAAKYSALCDKLFNIMSDVQDKFLPVATAEDYAIVNAAAEHLLEIRNNLDSANRTLAVMARNPDAVDDATFEEFNTTLKELVAIADEFTGVALAKFM